MSDLGARRRAALQALSQKAPPPRLIYRGNGVDVELDPDEARTWPGFEHPDPMDYEDDDPDDEDIDLEVWRND